ncbi:MAG: dihydrofolate reductase family protein [Saprospiraceae bacterium]|nr:dihydrofolate reductase family protein [Saprospiraceae bacterium]
MRNLISFMHMSLDGYVAGPNGEMNWIQFDQELFDHVGRRLSDGDSAMYGRITWQMMENYWPDAAKKPNATQHDIEHSQWYNRIRKLVLSRTMKDAEWPHTTFLGDDIARQIRSIKQQAGPDIMLFGSPTATHALMDMDLVDGFWLFVNPVILGRGISLFSPVKDQIRLRLLPATRQFDCGVTELNYAVDRST